jgi:hypothetical protein
MTNVEMKQEVQKYLNNYTLTNNLRLLAKNNEVFNAMAHVFAMRERTRDQVTVHTISTVMAKEGYNFTAEQYRVVLEKLAMMQVGTVQTDRKGRVSALKSINITLQSLGKTALSMVDTLVKASGQSKRYIKLPELPEAKVIEIAPPVIVDNVLKVPIKESAMTIKIGNKTINFDLFPESALGTLMDSIDKIYNNKNKKG